MSKASKVFIVSLLINTLFLSGCNNNSNSSQTSSSTTSQIIPNENHYDERNFIDSDIEISQTKLKVYDGPNMLTSSSKVDIKVEDEDLFVYETRVNHRRKFTYDYSQDTNPVAIFDFQGKVHVEIIVKDVDTITNVKISPLVYGIEPTVNENKISFDLIYNDNYIVEYNNDADNVIHLFANEIEKNPLSEEDAKKDDSIIYIGPGIYEAGAIPVESNSTIYIAGGAYVYGKIRGEGLTNLTIRGHGIISGEIYDRRMENESTIPVEIRSSTNVTIEGITFLDPAGWCMALYKSKDVTINNVKIITARANGDGISVQSCENVYVNKGFVRTWDDSLVVKNVDRGTTKNINFNGVTVWTDLAQSMEVGYETYGPTMDDITFKNITVVHNYHKPVISLHNCDDSEIRNVTYEDITVEDGQMLGDDREDGENDFFIDMTIAYSPEWTKSEGNRGSVDGVKINNVKLYKVANSVISRINGESADSMIKNVTISNIDYAGKKINSEADLGLVKNTYASGINISTTSETKDILGAKIALPYKLNLNTQEVVKEVQEGVEQEGLIVPEFAYLKGELAFIGSKCDVSAYNVVSSHGAGNKATTLGDDGTGVFESENHESSLAFDNDPSTYYESGAWRNEDDEFACLKIDFGDDLKYIGVIRIKGLQNNKFLYDYDIAIFGRKIKNDGTINDKYTRILSTRSYSLSPSNGNAIDLNIVAQDYAGIEIRFARNEGITAVDTYKISEIEFYSPSLTFNKAVVSSTAHNDVYPVEKVVDGDTSGSSYYESKTLPAHIVIDLGDVHTLQIILLSLNPSLVWTARTQNIEISVSDENRAFDSNIKFTTIFEAQDYLFDPQTGNRVSLNVPNGGVKARYLKVVINTNSAVGGYGAQLAEISAYGN